MFFSNLNVSYSVICFSKTWLDDSALAWESLNELPNNRSIHQVSNHGKGGADSIYVIKPLISK